MTQGISRPTVFLVESDETSRNRLGNLIHKLDVDIQPFTCAEEFLSQINSRQCACLVVNVRLSGRSGVELLESVKRLKPGLPTVMLDDRGSVETAVRVMRAGAMDYIETPFVHDCLPRAVRSALRRSSEANARTRK